MLSELCVFADSMTGNGAHPSKLAPRSEFCKGWTRKVQPEFREQINVSSSSGTSQTKDFSESLVPLQLSKQEVFIHWPVVFQRGNVRSVRDYLVERQFAVEDDAELTFWSPLGAPLHHVCNS